jgi:hypothetical protein
LFASLAVIWIKNYNFLTRRKVENLHRNECWWNKENKNLRHFLCFKSNTSLKFEKLKKENTHETIQFTIYLWHSARIKEKLSIMD